MPKDIKKRIPAIVASLRRDKDVVALFSFGSLAKDTLKPLSDLDFGVLLSKRMDKKVCIDKHLKLVGVFIDSLKTEEVDLINMNQAPVHINFQILKIGQLLICNDRCSLIDYHEQIVRSYLDFKFVRDEFDSLFLKGVGYHG